MDKERIKAHLNYIEMSESDKARYNCIERIFNEGVQIGWKEAGQCPKCLKDIPEVPINCPYCKENANSNKNR